MFSLLPLSSSFAEESMKLALRQQENVNNTMKRVKDEERPVLKVVEAEVNETKEHKTEMKLFPHSQLFRQWGEDLSEAQQKKAQDLFRKVGYNAYLSNQLPLNRTIPDTRDYRWDEPGLGF